eukprot:6380149-Prymnesium_polylepis.1
MVRVSSLTQLIFSKWTGIANTRCTATVVDLLGAAARHKVLNIEKDMQAWANLVAALLDELAHILAQWPGGREEEVEARRRIEPRQVRKFLSLQQLAAALQKTTPATPAVRMVGNMQM